MDEIIYSKTGKGLCADNTGVPKLPVIAADTLSQINGKSGVSGIHRGCPSLSLEEIELALNWLLKRGFIKALICDSQMTYSPDAISVDMLDQEKSVQEWAKAQRMAKSLANKGYCSSGNTKQSKPNNPSILLVEDDPLLAKIEMAILAEDGYLVHHVGSGELALERLQMGTLPDVLILDIMLPGRNGFETLRTIRSTPETSSLPVIIVTSRITDEDVMEGLVGGADGYIFKPFRPEKLTRYLLEVLGWL